MGNQKTVLTKRSIDTPSGRIRTARGFFWSACDCLAYQTHVTLWSKDGQTTAKNKRASLHQIDWNVATAGAQPA